MFSKEGKKHYILKLLGVAIILFLVIIIFIEPKPTVQHIEKALNVQIENVQ